MEEALDQGHQAEFLAEEGDVGLQHRLAREAGEQCLEAAHVAGLSRWTVIKGIIAPNAIRLGLRNYGNEMIFVVKATSIASLVTIQELMARASGVYYRTYDPITPLLIAGAIFLVLILALSSFMALLEVRLSPELRRKAERARPRAGKTAPGLTAVDGPSLPQTPGTGR